MQETDPSKARNPCTTTVRLDAEYCHNWFNSIAKTIRTQQQSMPDALTITYEELSQDLSKTTATVFREIGLEPVAVEPRIRKKQAA